MADPRFFVRRGPFSLAQLAAICGGDIAEGVDGTLEIEDVAGLADAQAGAISFFQSVKYADALAGTNASAVIVNPANQDKLPSGLPAIVAENPHKSYALVAQAFYPAPRPEPGISAGAHIADTAQLGDDVAIAPGVVIEDGVEIGAGTYIGPNTTIARNVKVGQDCWIAPQVSLTHCLVGDRVTIHTGARIGQDGFGFAIGLDGHVSLPQLGRAILQDGVNIGANSCVDRGAGEDTVIGEGTFIDNQVQVGHNTVIGRHCAISGRSGISGSVTIGDYAVLGGGAGIADHINIGVGAQVGAGTGVIRDVPPGERVFGYPALPLKQFMRQVAMLKKMTEKKGK